MKRPEPSNDDDPVAELLRPLPDPPAPKPDRGSWGTGSTESASAAASGGGDRGREHAGLRRLRPHLHFHLRRRGHYDRSVPPVRRPHRERHPLHPFELVSMGWRTARLEPARVVVPGLVIFGLDAFTSTWFTEISVDHLGLESLTGFVFFGVSTLGLTFYAGMLERLVGAVERNQIPQPVSKVLATLPWIRLLGAEVVLAFLSAVAAFFLVVPALVVGTLCTLVGPLINLLDCSVSEAFKRSVRLVWPHFWIVLLMITVPLALEHEVVVLIANLVPHERVFVVFATNFALGAAFGIALGLIEVSLAERMITGAHGPGEPVRSEGVEGIGLGPHPTGGPSGEVAR
jgi:hypothetical protein